MPYQESIPKNITTSATGKPTTPQVIIENTSVNEIYCNLIEILPNVDFARNGVLEIDIDEIPVLDNKNENFRSYSKYPLPLGKKIQGRGEIRIYAWNKNDGNEIRCDFNVHLSDSSEPISSVAIPLTQDALNNAFSAFETLFPYAERATNSYAALIDMKGCKKLIVMLSGIQYIHQPSVITNDFGNNSFDGNLLTSADFNYTSSPLTPTKIEELDFGSIASRLITAKFTALMSWASTGSMTITMKIQVRNTLVDSWTDVYTKTISHSFGGGGFLTEDFSGNGGTVSFRYARVTVACSGNDFSGQYHLYELYDALDVGGSASLSFQVKNSLGNWIELIAASEFGTVAFLGSDISKQVGDVNTVSVSGKTYALPSTQTNFRALYVIAGSRVSNAVDILRVA